MIWFFGRRTGLKLQAASVEGAGLVSILHSEYRWRKVRNEHIKHESCCQMCEVVKKLEVHHIQPWHLAPDLRYDPENLVTLCRECHYRFGHWLNWKDFNPEIVKLCKYATGLKNRGEINEKDENVVSGSDDPGCRPVHICVGSSGRDVI